VYHILYRVSMFDLAFNQNHVTRFIRMMYVNFMSHFNRPFLGRGL
jgi:hypothetical protein